MITDGLFEQVLVDPAQGGADSLYVVSGFATSSMAYRHLHALRRVDDNVKINLIVGMCPNEGISRANHLAFQRLVSKDYLKNFSCRYLVTPPSVHTKVYSWVQNDTPISGFNGSANYSIRAFFGSQREALSKTDAENAFEYYNSLLDETLDCLNSDIESHITIYDEVRRAREEFEEEIEEDDDSVLSNNLPHVNVNLLDRYGQLPTRSGLNWGQRPQREPNQAYISLKVDAYRSNFFPPIEQHFILRTDDGCAFVCARAQQNGKAIHTPYDNSILGRYFRKRIGVEVGHLVRSQDLVQYGRTDIDFYRIDDETYYMDFSVTYSTRLVVQKPVD